MRNALPILVVPMLAAGCTKPPAKANPNVGGYVIGMENCRSDSSQNYWLLDLTVHTWNPQLGDTLFIENVTYTNVVKMQDLHPQLQTIGMRVSIEYSGITDRTISSDCNV